MTPFAKGQGKGRRLWLAGLSALLLTAAQPVQAASEQQELVDKATQTIKDFKAHPDMTWFRDHLPNAKAVVIVPVLLKAGFIFGGSGGHGMLLVRDNDGTGWSYPAFNFMGSVTFGLQIGGEAAQVVLMVMTDKGVNSMLSTELKLGADVSLAAGPIGAGAQAATTDVLAFSMDKGLFGGLTIEGAVIEPGAEWNQAYYGKSVSTRAIVIERMVANAGADALRAAIAGAAGTGTTVAPAPVDYNISVIQKALTDKGYDPGVIDGQMGPKTRAAITAYQNANGLEPNGQPSAFLQEKLLAAP
ncbi:MAG: YSC84-related protein [Pseudomonadota bacterium]